MPPKVTDTRAANAEALHAVEVETAEAAQRIVATYAEDFLDATTIMCMLGVEPEGLIHRRVLAEIEAENAASSAKKKTTKKAAKKSTKKTTAKKTTKKAAAKKSTAKKTTKKATKTTPKKS
ncbi:hypothetical protein [Corynebacterium bovis]|uniref:Histone n=1 Tax=Corynebacterium bovis DSM 20582 = CIP 54.80 TaxID=927655 RepID=A0A8H9Y7D8_9CORY|nr:hypothetical protein [Corynebacterium bovis]MBB3115420.1 hypothetical protein [Corynebacterium bovis DSM 20582 = CIP 54.80]MDH2456539.1 hypothetical protein [Corynebacterium bovis]QQC48298.1 hypothetical protein I6I09_05405 [Corynebacterium bovis]RRO96849.1 hypothetical protein CXF29_00705 [Corynebacterium bovis]RRQ12535.1 hypothetical protein CXF47_08625 [Corynebacterium bovis]